MSEPQANKIEPFPNLRVTLAGVALQNPVMNASGCFASGKEYADFVDINRIGAVVVKGTANVSWPGNPPPRIAETYGGMLNSVGLQNQGVEAFLRDDVPFLRPFTAKIIVNVIGRTPDEYAQVAERLQNEPVDMLELNFSCPNVKQGGMAIGLCPKDAQHATALVKRKSKQPIMVKLSPNVTDIVEIARACEAGGADALSLINTLVGMKIDIHKRRAVLANKIGGLSGPAIKPVAVRMVWQVSKAVKIPVVGLGGIMNGEDAVEFIMAGATAIQVGTANFSNPRATVEVVQGIERFMRDNNIRDLSEIRGIVE